MIGEYLHPFLNGILFGVPFCLAAGPVFFMLIHAGCNRGFHLAIALAIGVLLGDVLLIYFSYSFVDVMTEFYIRNKVTFRFILFVILLVLSVYTLFKKTNVDNNPVPVKYNVFILFFIYGFMLDVFNPSNLFVWVSVTSYLIHYNSSQHIVFYISSLTTMAILMIMLAFLAQKIKPFLGVSFTRKFNVFTGLIYLICSLTILFQLNSK